MEGMRTHVAERWARPSCCRCLPQLEGHQAQGPVRLVRGRAAAEGPQSHSCTGLPASMGPVASSLGSAPPGHGGFKAVFPHLYNGEKTSTMTFSERSPRR